MFDKLAELQVRKFLLECEIKRTKDKIIEFNNNDEFISLLREKVELDTKALIEVWKEIYSEELLQDTEYVNNYIKVCNDKKMEIINNPSRSLNNLLNESEN